MLKKQKNINMKETIDRYPTYPSTHVSVDIAIKQPVKSVEVSIQSKLRIKDDSGVYFYEKHKRSIICREDQVKEIMPGLINMFNKGIYMSIIFGKRCKGVKSVYGEEIHPECPTQESEEERLSRIFNYHLGQTEKPGLDRK